MEVKTESGGTFDAAGQGSKALGIVGTILGGLGVAMGGLLGGNSLFGNRTQTFTDDADGRFITKAEFSQEKEYAKLFADYKSEIAERYTDDKVIKQAEKEAAKDAKLAQDMLDIGIGVTKISEQMTSDREKQVLRDQIADLRFKNLEEKIKNSEEKSFGAIALESERRMNGDQNLYSYCNATFVPGKMYMPAASVTPEPMPLTNAWVAPTTTTTTTA